MAVIIAEECVPRRPAAGTLKGTTSSSTTLSGATNLPGTLRAHRSAGRRRFTRHVVTSAIVLTGSIVVAAIVLTAPSQETGDVSQAAGSSTPLGAAGLTSGTAGPTSGTTDPEPGTPATLTDASGQFPPDQPPASADPSSPGYAITSGRDAPDGFLIRENGRDYLYTSEGSLDTINVPVQEGRDVGHLGPVHDAMPELPGWAMQGFTWAPDVHRFGPGDYVLYFTSISARISTSTQCIGIATGTGPAGPFVPEKAPFICQLEHHGSIDPRVFVDRDGTPYMIWKSDDNADPDGTADTIIWSQRLSRGGLHLLGRPTPIFSPDEPWQGRIVESPDLELIGGTYSLFYSGGWFNQPGYAIGVAQCSGPMGPCHDTGSTPWLGSNTQGAGPGEESVFVGHSGIYMLYAPWASQVPVAPTPPRPVEITRLGVGPLGVYLAAWAGGDP